MRVRSFITYNAPPARLHIRSEERDHNATPSVTLTFDSCDARRAVYSKDLTGADAAEFIAWSRGQGVDVRGSVMLAELPEAIAMHLPAELKAKTRAVFDKVFAPKANAHPDECTCACHHGPVFLLHCVPCCAGKCPACGMWIKKKAAGRHFNECKLLAAVLV